MSRGIFAPIFFATFLFPAIAEADWIVSPYIGARIAGTTNFVLGRDGIEENKVTFGSAVGFLSAGVLGVEADVTLVPGFFDGPSVTSSWVTAVMGNVIIATPLGIAQYGLRPYVTGGAGLLRARADDQLGPVITTNFFGMNVGGGALGPLTRRSSVRFDLRYFRNLTDAERTGALNQVLSGGTQLSFWRGTVGLSFRF